VLEPVLAPTLNQSTRRADDATRAQAVSNLLAKANLLLDLGTSIVANAIGSSSISAACGDALQDFLADIRQCVQGLPREP